MTSVVFHPIYLGECEDEQQWSSAWFIVTMLHRISCRCYRFYNSSFTRPVNDKIFSNSIKMKWIAMSKVFSLYFDHAKKLTHFSLNTFFVSSSFLFLMPHMTLWLDNNFKSTIGWVFRSSQWLLGKITHNSKSIDVATPKFSCALFTWRNHCFYCITFNS